VAIKYSTVALRTCASSVRNLLCAALLTPRVLRLLLVFWKLCSPLM